MRATRLHTENHLRARLPSCVTPALTYYRYAPNGTPRHPPKEATGRNRRLVLMAPVLTDLNRYGNINPFIHSTTPVGLALGPDSPRDDERCPGTLGHPAAGIVTPLSLLMSAFSLPHGPPSAYATASPHAGRSPTQYKNTAASSVACLSPATLSAQDH